MTQVCYTTGWLVFTCPLSIKVLLVLLNNNIMIYSSLIISRVLFTPICVKISRKWTIESCAIKGVTKRLHVLLSSKVPFYIILLILKIKSYSLCHILLERDCNLNHKPFSINPLNPNPPMLNLIDYKNSPIYSSSSSLHIIHPR